MLRFHWFSPLPPDRTDIGHFTNRILPALDGKAEVTIWTPTENPVAPALDGVTVRPIGESATALAELNRADAVFYNMGNHGPYHADILEAMWRVPGLVILHEADLHGLFAHYWLERVEDGEAYIDAMTREHGREGRLLAMGRLRGDPVEAQLSSFPLLQPALKNALGVMCHTDRVEEAVTHLGLPVMQVPLAYAPSPAARVNGRSGPIRLLQFGYLGPHRRIESVLAALARNRAGGDYRFDIYGQIWDGAHIRKVIAELGLEDIVTLRGFVPDAELDAAIREADMVFNLRFPTVGEASGTQLRIWNGAAPSIVSDVGWFGSLPQDTVLKAHPDQEHEALDRLFRTLGENRHAFDALGLAGRRHLEEHHHPDAYAASLIEAAADLGELRTRAGAVAAAQRFGEVTAARLEPHAAVLREAAIARLAARLAATAAKDQTQA